ncbi:MAG TPA: CoA ester lyase [Actinomycetes bacterium]|jgi:citrate lyase subunit beta/citryl-CoA lyase|nr:CoA ester lyase [Actinomycetes bacterium]
MIGRSYLFVPGHNERLLAKAFDAGSDAVILDLEDAVPDEHKSRARELVAGILAERQAWVRVNAAFSDLCREDLRAVAASAAGIRIPKVESAHDVRWVVERAPGIPLICAIESARGVLAAPEIASVPVVSNLALGGMDLARDLRLVTDLDDQGPALDSLEAGMLFARSQLVLASSAAGIDPPIDSVYPYLEDDAGLRRQARLARRLGFFGKSAIHPRQLPILHEVFTPSQTEMAWAKGVAEAFAAGSGNPVRTADGEFVDLPVAQRARQLLDLVGALPQQRGPDAEGAAGRTPGS